LIPISDPDLRRRRWPFVNVALIAVSAIVFLYELSLGSTDRMLFFYQWGLIPAELTDGVESTGLITNAGIFDITSPWPAWGTLFSSMFIHGGFAHFIGNMLFLWVFGDNVESRLGHVQYLLFYLAAGVAASWTQIAVDTGSDIPTIGASGAIAGVLGAYLLFYPFSRVNTLVIFFFISMVRVPAIVLLGVWFLLQLFSGVGSLGPTAQSSGGVAYWAHVGGFVAGVLLALMYALFRGQPLQWTGRRSSWRWRQ
jgi:membrane associated rhomboid family serine protease